MATRIRLRTNFSLPRSSADEASLPFSKVRELLRWVEESAGFIFVDWSGGTLRKDVEVVINGKNLLFYPTRFETDLKDGDIVDIQLLTLGGG
jgi:hypothetical protein